MPSISPNLSVGRKYVLSFTLATLVVCAGGGGLYVYGTSQKLPSHMQIAHWQAGGLTYDQFQQQLEQQLDRYDSLIVHVESTNPDVPSKDLTLSDLGLVVQPDELNQAMQKLFHASIADRIAARWTLRKAEIPLSLNIDADKLSAKVRQSWKDLYARKPVSARRIVESDDSIRYEAERLVPRVDLISLKKELQTQIPDFTGNLDEKDSLKINIPIYMEQPTVTADSLKQQGVERKISEFTTIFPISGQGRIHNIRSTAASIQDMLLAPGDTFDYSKIIEQTEAKVGYQEAPVIVDGKLVPGIGGGICQVSSTLYNAVLRSGLEIVERRNHSLPVSYVPLGQDATFASGFINFKFRNTTNAYLLIRTVTTDQNVTVKLFGRTPASESYDIESKVVETIPPTTKYLHNPSLRLGSTQAISKGREGYVVETYRIKKVNGAVVSKELISKDRYSASPTLVASNRGDVKPEEGNTGENHTPIIEDGVKGPKFR